MELVADLLLEGLTGKVGSGGARAIARAARRPHLPRLGDVPHAARGRGPRRCRAAARGVDGRRRRADAARGGAPLRAAIGGGPRRTRRPGGAGAAARGAAAAAEQVEAAIEGAPLGFDDPLRRTRSTSPPLPPTYCTASCPGCLARWRRRRRAATVSSWCARKSTRAAARAARRARDRRRRGRRRAGRRRALARLPAPRRRGDGLRRGAGRPPPPRTRAAATKGGRYGPFLSGLRDLKVGDYIVHADHGIAQFIGLRTVERRRRAGGQPAADPARRGAGARRRPSR